MIVPITRKEKLLNAIATNGNVDFVPKTREELFLFKILGADVNTPTPITRKELLYQHIIDGTIPTFEPRTRLEKFIMAAAGVGLELPVVLTREEYWWAEISDNAYETITGAIVHFISKRARAIKSLIANISYTQDLNGYSYPWPAGGRKNVLPTPTEAQTVNGVTATPNADGSITLTGTASAIAYFDLITGFDSTAYAGYIVTGLPDDMASNSSTICYRISTASSRASLQDIQRGVSGTYTNNTIVDNGTNLVFALRVNNGYALPDGGLTLYPMMRASSASADFEPYSNICPISGATEVNVTRTGKNLLPNNLTFTNGVRDDDGNHSVSTISHYTNAVPIKSNTAYTFKGPSNSNYRVYFLSDGQSWISRTDIIRQREFSFTTQSNCKYIQIQCSNSVNLETAQLELGSTATDYEPYTGNSYNVTFPAVGKNISPQSTVTAYSTGALNSTSGTFGTVEAGKTYTISFVPKQVNAKMVRVTVNAYANLQASWNPNQFVVNQRISATFTATESGSVILYANADTFTASELVAEDIQIEEGSTATAYEPYTTTVYGGTLDVVSGLLTVTHGIVDLGSMSFEGSTPHKHVFRTGNNPIQNMKPQPSGASLPYAICESYYPKAWTPISASDNGAFAISIPSQGNKLVIVDHRFTSTSAFETAVSGVKLVYELATPQTYQLTPTEVTTLLGDNTIWADTGDVSVTY